MRRFDLKGLRPTVRVTKPVSVKVTLFVNFYTTNVTERRYGHRYRTRGFTYIEVLITLAMLGMLFVPMMQLFSHGLSAPAVSSDVITACHLARWEMERVKNLNLTTSQLKKQGDRWTPVLEELPLTMNNTKWRLRRHIHPGSDPLEVSVEVFKADNLEEPVASLVTLIGDSIWTEVKEGM